MDYSNLPGIQIGRLYVESPPAVNQLQALECTDLLRVELILDLESKHCGMYEAVCSMLFTAF